MGLTITALLPLGWQSWKGYQLFHQVIVPDQQLQKLLGEILHLDEVLTSSTTLAAATGDPQWEKRYRNAEPQLDSAIRQAIAVIHTHQHPTEIDALNAANLQLVALEQQAFASLNRGDRHSAREILNSSSYTQQKAIYNQGLVHLNQAIQQHIESNKATLSRNLASAILLSGVSIGGLLPLWLIILRTLGQYLSDLKATRLHLQQNNQTLESRVEARTTELTQAMERLQQVQLQLVQHAKMSALGDLVSGVAHEINNPISCIVGNVTVLEQYSIDLLSAIDLYQTQFPKPGAELEATLEDLDLDYLRGDLPKLLRAMRDGGDRITAISRSLRSFSRADQEKKCRFNLHEGLDSTLLILRHRLKGQAGRPDIQVITDYREIPEIDCFPSQLNQVFMNLLANAIDALEESPPERPQITVSTQRLKDGIRIAIADNGPGIAEAQQAQIFEHLFTTKAIGKGTGLGLAIAQRIITQNHGGSLSVESQLGQGSTFLLMLPV